MGTMTFWDRIPRIGPILQRTFQKHFHRTKTRFRDAFDFWAKYWALALYTPHSISNKKKPIVLESDTPHSTSNKKKEAGPGI